MNRTTKSPVDVSVVFNSLDEGEFINPTDRRTTIISGPNNSGKSQILKYLFDRSKQKTYYCGVNRYWEATYFKKYKDDPESERKTVDGLKGQLKEADKNTDPLMVPFPLLFIQLSDVDRNAVCEVCSELLGEHVKIGYEDPENTMSDSYLMIGTTPIWQCSSGSRMLVLLVTILVSKKYERVLIDEPELGLAPRVQSEISHFIMKDPFKRLTHLTHIYLVTHSHIFLDIETYSNNFVVSRMNSTLEVRRITGYQDFNELRFSQLGNSLIHFQLPEAFLLVEGPTDSNYIRRLIKLRLPRANIHISAANGDGELKKKLHDLLQVIGKLDTSPYRGRVIVLVDGIHSPTLKSDLEKHGLAQDGIVAWMQNGIEYYYPESILREIYKDATMSPEGLTIKGDKVSHRDITYTKTELCNLVLDRITGQETLKPEVEALLEKFTTM